MDILQILGEKILIKYFLSDCAFDFARIFLMEIDFFFRI